MQRVAIARALANRPALILADEPTGELDGATGREIMSLFRRLNDDGTTLVVVTHDEHLAREATHVIHMLDGAIERVRVHRLTGERPAGGGAPPPFSRPDLPLPSPPKKRRP